jgi:hypothetical protein
MNWQKTLKAVRDGVQRHGVAVVSLELGVMLTIPARCKLVTRQDTPLLMTETHGFGLRTLGKWIYSIRALPELSNTGAVIWSVKAESGETFTGLGRIIPVDAPYDPLMVDIALSGVEHASPQPA